MTSLLCSTGIQNVGVVRERGGGGERAGVGWGAGRGERSAAFISRKSRMEQTWQINT